MLVVNKNKANKFKDKTDRMKYILLVFSLLISVSINAQKRLIKVDSSKVWVNTIGIENRKEGQPVVVFESGYGTPMDNWDKVLARL